MAYTLRESEREREREIVPHMLQGVVIDADPLNFKKMEHSDSKM